MFPKLLSLPARWTCYCLCALVTLSAAQFVAANSSPAPLLAVEDFFRNAAYSSPALSPDGRFLAAIVPTGERRNIAVVDIETRSVRVVTGQRRNDVFTFRWANNDTVLFQVENDGIPATAIFAIERNGSGLRTLVRGLPPGQMVYRYTHIFNTLSGDPQHILIINNERRIARPDVFRLNVLNGRRSIVARNPGNVTEWGVDHEGQVRTGTTVDDQAQVTGVIWRESHQSPWVELASFGAPLQSRSWSPVTFDDDNHTLLIASNEDADTAGLYAYDPLTRQRGELIFRDNRYDAPAGMIVRQADRKILGFTHQAERSTTVWFDDEMNRWQREIDRLHSDTRNAIVSMDHAGRRQVWAHFSDRQPAKFSLLDLSTRKLEPLFESRPWINPEHMAPMRPITFTARDGRQIPGYLTLPVGHGGKPGPLIIHPHGGPWARDGWGFNPEVQFLANRGFAVLQVDFRGSTGYGFDHLIAARHQFGKAMQDDLSDAVAWAIAEGYADPKQVGIYGASYGGYATMAGLVFTPELYAFGINYVGVVDVGDNINWWRETEREDGFHIWSNFFGHPVRDREALAAISPVNFIENLNVPLFVIHGMRDPQVPYRQYEKLVSALRRAGKPFESLTKADEGHGFYKEENKVELYKKFDEFLAPFSERLRTGR